ncbi:hypothetical protein [Agromyces binzhouensis]|uniref:Uncharacterized protein n=1 Tax=Agromyces binzhouensis TaxID=1817495 RepID=A0A4Q2JX74_9MICO|nr:hypothetical protein [Agromyces binzhouensis]RXZ51856.1 hypothetical protein ESO86_00445 [Agromyces binzhouensis]
MASPCKIASLAGTSLLVVLVLTGCIDSGSGFAVLERDAVVADALPADLPDYADDELEPLSSRFVGEHDGNMLFLAKGKEPGTVCLAVYPNATDWVIGCGGGSAEFGVGGPSGGYIVRPDGAPAPELHREVATNVFARG